MCFIQERIGSGSVWLTRADWKSVSRSKVGSKHRKEEGTTCRWIVAWELPYGFITTRTSEMSWGQALRPVLTLYPYKISLCKEGQVTGRQRILRQILSQSANQGARITQSSTDPHTHHYHASPHPGQYNLHIQFAFSNPHLPTSYPIKVFTPSNAPYGGNSN